MNQPRETEYRSTVVSKVEPNTAGPQQDGLPKQFWARVMNYGELDDFGTKFKPGVFKKSLDRRLPRLMYGHQGWENPSALLGRGIDYRDTHDGLEVLFEFDDFDYVPAAKQIAHQMTNHPDNPTLDQFSVGFKRVKDERAAQQDGGGVWITEARLGEVSVVVEGAVPGTKTLQFRGANGTIVEGQTIDAQDAARLLAELSTGKLDLAEALMAVKSLAAETDDEPDDPFADEPDEPDPGDGEDDPELDDEQLAELRKWIDAVDAEEEAAAQAKLAADDALLASIDADLSIVSRSRLPFEVRGEGGGHAFHGNQFGHGGGGAKHAMSEDDRKDIAAGIKPPKQGPTRSKTPFKTPPPTVGGKKPGFVSKADHEHLMGQGYELHSTKQKYGTKHEYKKGDHTITAFQMGGKNNPTKFTAKVGGRQAQGPKNFSSAAEAHAHLAGGAKQVTAAMNKTRLKHVAFDKQIFQNRYD